MQFEGFGKRLKESIKGGKYSQKELSAKMRISEDSLTRYIQEKQYPKIDFLVNFCNLQNVNLEWLVTGKESKNILSENENELLAYFKQLDDREQLKIIGMVEDRVSKKCQEETSSTSNAG